MSSECSEAEALESGVRGRGGPALPCRDIPLHLPMMDHGAKLLRACDTLDRATGRARSHRAAASRRARATSAEGGDPRLGRLGLRESDRRGSVVEPRALRGASAVPALPGRLRRRSGGRAAGRRHDDIREGEVERACSRRMQCEDPPLCVWLAGEGSAQESRNWRSDAHIGPRPSPPGQALASVGTCSCSTTRRGRSGAAPPNTHPPCSHLPPPLRAARPRLSCESTIEKLTARTCAGSCATRSCRRRHLASQGERCTIPP
mmetsp:Transcript_10106/g.30408  ORF Transcript_10106/g.30408 Transcript_10106/m.30408 type:complete len:261 (+) Transcript_10106:281-1063(+)